MQHKPIRPRHPAGVSESMTFADYALEDAASEQDPPLALYAEAYRQAPEGSSFGAVALALSEGLRPAQVAEKIGLSKATVGYHCLRFGPRAGLYVGRRPIIATLGRAGVRVGELCDIEIGHLVLRGVEGSRVDIPDAKTESGIREVELSDDLVEIIEEHLDRLAKAGYSTGPKAPLFPNSRGCKLSRSRGWEIVSEAAKVASGQLQQHGLPPLGKVSPHTMRRTYISIALIANKMDYKWVMDQVGHSDSTMTLDVYNQLQKRVNRKHGAEFDRLMREAREHYYDRPEQPPEGVLAEVLAETGKNASRKPPRRRRGDHQNPPNAGQTRLREPAVGFAGTRFSVVCSTN